ncbi:hypothetical protein COT27_01475 [Candidatus Kuenenbacteria bacterium CG08_land_8_20_14_0_20_37_23]|uniref:Uncharacterized protein n=1 Tax=Candidatus Kuenenbacteria bacterium CG08_land_8_20_14_0_20_37_23 TaxID=1974617 RepID=A0A2M6XT39_9BACT|nr:MAG: hypothetical protein COT27_01475 [Candidatus Kuenenbacteria bacterium CG08_land_8_20_14_0_20_37_23]
MVLPKKEARLFFKLYLPLLGYANLYNGKNKKRTLAEVRKLLYKNPRIFKGYISNNPNKLNKENLAIIENWQRFIKGDFILIKSFAKYSILLKIDNNMSKVYGVLGLTDSPLDLAVNGIGTYFKDVVLLPWKNQIIWDGLFCLQPIIIGRNYIKSFINTYKEIKKKGEIIDSI